ncbi:Cd2+/Zn2+-exporting ATPase [Halolactibacillus halophilus]|uniref:ATPase n=1 Tax=Halolactibacillus halophilus TaxID=306540 RepID=A0A1I5N0V5_9BACI|nr:heavy metal translocating P-type ATPase [Halolactibacillus halophilus]GEM01103.1 ATPase [Halolactibacillus halophilus]SFP15307.1 Cd2+/Zn2+-exporting ATPase [Halolactibacillus halophilus]
MSEITKNIINNNKTHSQLVQMQFKKVKKHQELIAAIISGALILIAWVFSNQLPGGTYITLNILAFLVGGYAKAKEGITETIENKTLNVELLMILAAIGSAVIGYWVEGAILIFIFSLSGAMETYTMQKSERDLSNLMHLQPDQALRINDDNEELVSIDELSIGDLIYVKPGERMPVDGKIIKGRTAIDESALTGESIPVEKSFGDKVFTGTMNKSGSLTVEVTTDSRDSFVQKIMTLVRSAQSEKSPSQLFIEQFENVYVYVVLGVTALMMILPPFIVGWSWNETFYRAMILLVVASPCALVASITPATLSAISTSARRGMLVKSGVHLENFDKITAIAFDKTGTLTVGRPDVTDFITRTNEEDQEIIQRIIQIEKGSSHPLAEAMIRYSANHLDPLTVNASDEMTEVTGKGVKANFNGDVWAIGNEKLFNASSDNWYEQQATVLKGHAKTLVYVTKNDEVVAIVALKDEIRQDTIEAIKTFQSLGIETIMLTGDNIKTAEAIAEEVGLSRYVASCMPEDKVTVLKELREEFDTVMMVGDGINDAPALATAHIGVAMGAGTDVALETADIILIKNKLSKLVDLFSLSKRMNTIVKQNIFFSISVIVLLIVSNLFQFINLPLGVVGHEGSTILVILNGLRLLKYKESGLPS